MATNNLVSSGGRLRLRSTDALFHGRGLNVHTQGFSFSQASFNAWAAAGVKLIRLLFEPRDIETAVGVYDQTQLNHIHTSIQRARDATGGPINIVLCPLINSPVWSEAPNRLPDHWINVAGTGPRTPVGEWNTASMFDCLCSHGEGYLTKVMTEFRDYANVVGTDGCNEPDRSSAAPIHRGINRLLGWLRAADGGTEKLWFLVTNMYSSQSAATADNLWSAIDDWSRCVMQLHTYFAPQAPDDDGWNAPNGLRSADNGTHWNGGPEATSYSTANKAAFALHFASWKAEAEARGVPWGLGEAGVQHTKADAAQRLAWARDVKEAAQTAGAAYLLGWIGADNYSQDIWSSSDAMVMRPEYVELMTFTATDPTPGQAPTTPPTVVGYGALGATPNNASASMTATGMTLPSGVVAGDLLLMFVYFDTGSTTSGQSITTPAGWTLLLDTNSLTQGQFLRVYAKVAGGAEGAPPSPTFVGASTGTSTGGTGLCRVGAYRGVDVSNFPTSVLAGSSSGNTFTSLQNIGTIQGFTPTSDDVLVVVYGGKKDDWTSVATLTGDALTWAEGFESASTVSGDAGFVVDTAPVDGPPVAITGKTFTVTGGGVAHGLGRMLALRPGAGAPTVSGSTSISGGGVVTAAGRKGALSDADVSGGGAVAATGARAAAGDADVSGGGVVAAEGMKAASGAAAVSGGGEVVATGAPDAVSAVAVSGGGEVAASGQKGAVGDADVSGGGFVDARGVAVRPAQPGPVVVPQPSLEVVVAQFFTPGTVVDVVALTNANRPVWAHERKVRGRRVRVRPRQTPVASATADVLGTATFAGLMPGWYWIVGERDGVIRRVSRKVV